MLETQGSESNVPRSRIGDFSGPSSARGAKFRGVLASWASEGRGGLSAQGAEPDERGIGLGSGYLESIERQGQGLALLGALRMEQPRPRSGRCSGGQAEMDEDLGDHGGMFDTRCYPAKHVSVALTYDSLFFMAVITHCHCSGVCPPPAWAHACLITFCFCWSSHRS